MADRTVAEMIFNVKARTGKAERDLNKFATKLRSIRTVGIVAMIGIAASSGVAAAAIAVVGAAAAVATLALAALAVAAVFGFASMAFASAASSELVQQTWKRVSGEISSMWKRVTEGWVDTTHNAVHGIENVVLAMEPGLRKGFEVIRKSFDYAIDKLMTKEMGAKLGDAFGRAMTNMEPLFKEMIDITPGFIDGLIRLSDTLSKALGDNAKGIAEMFAALGGPFLDALGSLLKVLIEIGAADGAAFIDFLAGILDGFSHLGEAIKQGEFFQTLLKGLGDTFDAFFIVVGKLIEKLGPGLGKVFSQIGELLLALEPLLSSFGELFETIMETISVVIGELKGPLGDLSSAMGDLVDALTPIFIGLVEELAMWTGKLMEAVTPLVEGLTDWITENEKLAGTIANVTAKVWLLWTALGFMSTKAGALTKKYKWLKGVIAAVGGPIKWIIALVAILIAWFVNLWKTNDEFREKVTAAWEKVKEAFKTLAAELEPIINKMTEWWDKHGEKVMEFLGKVGTFLAITFIRWIEMWVTAIADAVYAATTTWNKITEWWDAFKTYFEELLATLKRDWDKMVSDIRNAKDAVVELFTKLWEGIKAAVAGVKEDIEGWRETWDNMKQKVGEFKDSLVEIFSLLWAGIKNAAQGIKDDVVTFFTTAWTTVKTKTTEFKDALLEAWSLMWDGIKNAISAIKDGVLEFITTVKSNIIDAWELIKTKTTEFKDGLLAVWAMIWGGIKSAVTNIREDITEFAGKVKTMFTDAWNYVKTKTIEFKDGLLAAWSMIWAGIKNAVTNIKADILEFADHVKNKISAAWDYVKAKTTEFKNSLLAVWGEMWTGIRTAAAKIKADVLLFITDVKAKFIEAWNYIKLKTTEFKNSLIATWGLLWGGIKNAAASIKASVVAFIRDLITRLAGIGPAAASAISDLRWRIANKISEALQYAKDIAVGKINSLLGRFSLMKSSILGKFSGAKYWLKSAGQNIIRGLMDGFSSMVYKFKSAWNTIVNRLPSTLASKLRMHSPSRVMIEMGGNVMKGLMLGLENAKMKPLKVMNEVGGSIADFKNGSGGAGSIAPSLSPAGTRTSRSQIITVELDGRTIARAMGNHMVDSIRVQTGTRIA